MELERWSTRVNGSVLPDLIVERDASLQGWGGVCRGVQTGGKWSQIERENISTT